MNNHPTPKDKEAETSISRINVKEEIRKNLDKSVLSIRESGVCIDDSFRYLEIVSEQIEEAVKLGSI